MTIIGYSQVFLIFSEKNNPIVRGDSMHAFSRYFKGYSLLIAIVVMIVITSFSLLLLSFFSINTRIASNKKTTIISRYYCLKGFEIMHLEKYLYDIEYLEKIDGFSLKLYKTQWGAFDIYHSTVLLENDTFLSKIAFFGNENNLQDSIALFIKSNDIPVYVSDKVFANGLLYVPDGKVKYLDYKSVLQPQLRDNSDTSLLSVNEGRITNLVSSLDLLEHVQLEDISENGFDKKTVLIKGEVIQVSKNLKGNIILNGQRVIVDKGVVLDNIIIIANSIMLPDGFKGRLQIFAFDSLLVGKSVECTYPSIFSFIQDTAISSKSIANKSVFLIDDSLKLWGEIFVMGNGPDERLPLLEMKEMCNVEGSIYSEGSVLFSGNIIGSIRCDKLLNKSKGIINENLLKNISIDRLKLPQYFGFSLLNECRDDAKKLKNICWLKK